MNELGCICIIHVLDINSQCREFEGGSPLHIAATNLCTEAVKLLLEHNADVTMKDYSGRTPLGLLLIK